MNKILLFLIIFFICGFGHSLIRYNTEAIVDTDDIKTVALIIPITSKNSVKVNMTLTPNELIFTKYFFKSFLNVHDNDFVYK